MTRRQVRIFFVAVAACASFLLAACGEDPATKPELEGPTKVTNSDGKIYDQAGWTTETDPVTGVQLRCLTVISLEYRGRGLGVWCYQQVQP